MMESNIEKIGELILVEHKTLPILFSEGKADDLVDEIEKKVRSFVPDIETTKGRKDIASLAHKIARSKTLLDNAGKQLTADWKAKAKLVDQERSRIWGRLETLQEEIRAPLTEYEEKEKQRVDSHQKSLDHFKTLLQCGLNYGLIDQMEKAIIACDDHFSKNWEEYSDQAKEIHEKCVLILKEKIANKKLEIEKQKREEAERKLIEERAARERDERIAEEKARLAAEAEAKRVKYHQEIELREKERIEREKSENKEGEGKDNKISECTPPAVMEMSCEEMKLEDPSYRCANETDISVYIVTELVCTKDKTIENIAVFSSEISAQKFIAISGPFSENYSIEKHELKA